MRLRHHPRIMVQIVTAAILLLLAGIVAGQIVDRRAPGYYIEPAPSPTASV